MRVVEKFLDPILEGVVEKRREAKAVAASAEKSTAEPETLLEHLVEYMEGMSLSPFCETEILTEFSWGIRCQDVARRAAEYLGRGARHRYLPYDLRGVHARRAPRRPCEAAPGDLRARRRKGPADCGGHQGDEVPARRAE